MKDLIRNRQLLGDNTINTIRESDITIVGCGGTGCMTLLFLLRLGAKRFTLIDFDDISPSNLNRQIFYDIRDIGFSKIKVLSDKIKRQYDIDKLIGHNVKIMKENIDAFIKDSFIFDCTDNFTTKFLLSEYISRSSDKVLFHSGVNKFMGQVMTINKDTACLDCFLKRPEKEDEKINIITPVAMTSSLQTQLFLDYINDFKERDQMIFFDLSSPININRVKLNKNIDCNICRRKHEDNA